MRTRFVVVLVVFMMVAAACSDDDAGGDDDAVAAPEGSEDATAEPEPVADPEPDSVSESDTEIDGAPESWVSPYGDHVSAVYDDPAVWICWPGADDVCSGDNDLTLVNADGSLEVVPFVRAEDAAIDCFYVYPTVSRDPTASSDLIPQDDQEIFTTRSQAARYGTVCDVYAPVYRQNTLPSLLGQVEAPVGVDTREVAYADVLDAWTYYISTVNNGRGFVLIGHSQGASLLRRLIAEEIDGVTQLQNQFVTAHLLGTSVAPGVDGSFATIGGCTGPDDVGCVVSYATFRSTAPPPDNSIFGRSATGPALCRNPADLEGGTATLSRAYLFNAGGGGFTGVNPFTEAGAADAITTAWVGYPDFIVGRCVDDGTFGYLEVEILGDPDDPRLDDIGGDLTPPWGLHLADAQVAMGDLVDLVGSQALAYRG